MEIQLTSPQQYNITSLKPINLFMAGVGSGKTHLGGVISNYFVTNFPHVKGMICANTYLQLTQSTMFRVREVWKDVFQITEGRDYVVGKNPPQNYNTEHHNFNDYFNIISFRNGAIIFMASLDNPAAHEGKEIGWCICDETKDTKEETIKEIIIARLRQRGIYIRDAELTKEPTDKAFNPLYILTSPAKVDWINEWFELEQKEKEIQAKIYTEGNYYASEFKNKCITISSTHHNIKNLSQGYIDNLLINHTDIDGKLKQSGKRLIYGDPFVKAGGEFYSSFDRLRHIKEAPFIEGLPVHISYDFNVVPYITLTCWQIKPEKGYYEVRCFDEFCLPSPDNSSERVSLAFKRKYGDKLKHGLYYYGDPTGNNRDTRSRRSDYDYIREALREYLNNMSDKVPRKAPAIIKRRDFVNNVLDEKFPIKIVVDIGCKKMIGDLEYTKEDVDGRKLKQVVTNPDTGQRYEKYGHTGDALDYMITVAFSGYYDKY
jgi:hypothetical protein